MSHKPFQVILPLLLFWSSIQAHHPVEGRLLPKLQETATAGRLPVSSMASDRLTDGPQVAEEGKVMERALIGSRPPRCEAIRCFACGRCEPVQVPVIPQQVRKQREEAAARLRTDTYYGDFGSNYKPMKWSCKCGDRIFNP